MALRVATPEEFAERLRFLLDNSQLKNLDELSTALERKNGHVWWLLHPETDNGPKRVNAQAAASCADFLSDRGRLVDDAPLLFNFLMGIENEWPRVLKPFLKVAPTGYGPESLVADRRDLPLAS